MCAIHSGKWDVWDLDFIGNTTVLSAKELNEDHLIALILVI